MTVLSRKLTLVLFVLQFIKPVLSRALRPNKEGLTITIVDSTSIVLDGQGNPVRTVVLTGLTNVSDFKNISTLIVQLEQEGPTWEIHKEKGTTTKNFFVGITSSRLAKASFYRCNGQIAGVIHDHHEGLWYEVKPDTQGHSVVSIIADAEVARIGPASDAAENLSFLLPAKWEPGSMKPSTESTKDSAVPKRWLLHSFLPSRWSRDFHEITIVDIMVVWTHDAECAKSLLPAECNVSTITHQNILLAVGFFVEETNAIFRNSGLHLKLRLAGGRRIEYQETTFKRALVNMKERRIPNVQEFREELKADLVMMLMDRSCDYPETGVAYNNYDHVDADYMYSVVAIQFTSVWYLPAHELGHNFGCSHDRGTANMCDDMKKSSYGYRDPRGQFRTIMSYPCQAHQCDDIHGFYTTKKMDCPLIPYFSNDRSSGRYFGASLGGSVSNCAGQIERVQHSVANLY